MTSSFFTVCSCSFSMLSFRIRYDIKLEKPVRACQRKHSQKEQIRGKDQAKDAPRRAKAPRFIHQFLFNFIPVLS